MKNRLPSWLKGMAAALLLGTAVPGLALLVTLFLALDRAPAVARAKDVGIGDVGHALAVARSHDPRRIALGQVAQARVTESDIELLLNHAANRVLGLRAQVSLAPAVAELVASRPWQLAGLSGWVNVQARWKQTSGLPELQSWRIGSMPLPTVLARPLLQALLARSAVPLDIDLASELVQQIRFEPGALSVDYVWRGDTAKRVLASLTPPQEQERLQAYALLLSTLAARDAHQGTISLPRLIGPLFELARQRSLHHDGALENRAAILTLTLYVTGRDLGQMLPAARAWAQPRRLQVVLNGRDDFPQHFLVSAMLAVESTSPLTTAVGLYKEVSDAQGGSGFSFNDLAANRAGQRFGRLAFEQPAKLQDLLAHGVDERSLMPDVADLPEYLSQAEFTRRYQRIGSPTYQRLLEDIERRVGALPLYR